MDMIVLFITCYNCEKQISRVLTKINASQLREVKTIWDKVVLIDNRSQDETINVAIKTIKNLKLKNVEIVINKKNYGLGGSHKIAYKYSKKFKASAFIILHGDDQGKIEDLKNLPTDYKKYGACLGSRFEKTSTITNYSKIRIIGNKLFNYIYSITLGTTVTDMGSGLNVFNVTKIPRKDFYSLPDDLTFNNCFLIYLKYHKIPFTFFPISWIELDQISNAKLYSQSIKILKYLIGFSLGFFKYFLKRKPIEYKFRVLFTS